MPKQPYQRFLDLEGLPFKTPSLANTGSKSNFEAAETARTALVCSQLDRATAQNVAYRPKIPSGQRSIYRMSDV